jgi:hypothetical protein
VGCSGGDGYAACDGSYWGSNAGCQCDEGDDSGDVGDNATGFLDSAENFVPGEQTCDVDVPERVGRADGRPAATAVTPRGSGLRPRSPHRLNGPKTPITNKPVEPRAHPERPAANFSEWKLWHSQGPNTPAPPVGRRLLHQHSQGKSNHRALTLAVGCGSCNAMGGPHVGVP